MKKTLLVLTFLLFLSATQSQLILRDEVEPVSMEQKIKYYFASVRGFIQGFSRGFYNNLDYLISDQCLDKNAYTLFNKLVWGFESGEFINPFVTFSILFQLNFMVEKSCTLDDITYDLSTFCNKAECDLSKISANIQNNIFKFIGTINSLAEIFANHDPDYTDVTEAFNKYDVIGQAMGSTIRILFNYR